MLWPEGVVNVFALKRGGGEGGSFTGLERMPSDCILMVQIVLIEY